MAKAVDALPEALIFFLQHKVGLVEPFLLPPKMPEMEQPSLAEGGEKRQDKDQGAKDIKRPGSRSFGLGHSSREETDAI